LSIGFSVPGSNSDNHQGCCFLHKNCEQYTPVNKDLNLAVSKHGIPARGNDNLFVFLIAGVIVSFFFGGGVSFVIIAPANKDVYMYHATALDSGPHRNDKINLILLME
jgi:hypothetical protein